MSESIYIEELSDGFDGDLIGMFAEGEFDDAQFLEAAQKYLDENYNRYDAGKDPAFKIDGGVKHDRWRRHHRAKYEGDELKPGRGKGSFLVTYVDIA